MALLCWFEHLLVPRAEICQIFHCFFGKLKIPKRHSEINWPLPWGLLAFFEAELMAAVKDISMNLINWIAVIV